MNDELKTNFAHDLQRLVGKECWGIVEGTGSIISFDFGAKNLREKPVDKNYLTDDVQNFESEFILFIFFVWRVDSKEELRFGAWTEHEIIHQEINRIVGQTVKSVELIEPAFDLKVTFSNDLHLGIFCDQTNETDENDNYDYFTPEIIYTVGHKSILETSKHD